MCATLSDTYTTDSRKFEGRKVINTKYVPLSSVDENAVVGMCRINRHNSQLILMDFGRINCVLEDNDKDNNFRRYLAEWMNIFFLQTKCHLIW